MKKIMILAMAAALLLAALALPGCGDEGKAAELMKEGDELSSKMRSLTYKADFDTAALLAQLGLEVSDTGNIQPVTDEANKQLESIIASGKQAREEYEKILDLKGADDYKAYAEKRISAINSTTRVLEAVQDLLDDLGDPSNTAPLKSKMESWAKAHVDVAADAVKAFFNWRDADKIRKDKNLGGGQETGEQTGN